MEDNKNNINNKKDNDNFREKVKTEFRKSIDDARDVIEETHNNTDDNKRLSNSFINDYAALGKGDKSLKNTKKSIDSIAKGKRPIEKLDLIDEIDFTDDYLSEAAKKENERKMRKGKKVRGKDTKKNIGDRFFDSVKRFSETETEGSYDNQVAKFHTKKNIVKLIGKAMYTKQGKIKLVKNLFTSGLLGWILGLVLLPFIICVLATVILFSGVAVLMMDGNSGGSNQVADSGSTSEDTDNKNVNVNVPKGLEGKFMLPLGNDSKNQGALHMAGIGGYGGHVGWDLAYGGEGPVGAGKLNVYPIYPGKVIYGKKGDSTCKSSQGAWGGTCASLGRGWGNVVVIKSEISGKKYYHLYGHMHEGTIKVNEGDKVGFGTVIGKMGNAGFSSGTHLHVEMRNNISKDLSTGQEYASHHTGVASDYLAIAPLITCGGKSGVMKNNGPGYTATKFTDSCYEDADKARKKK